MSKERENEAECWKLADIFVVNGAMRLADRRSQEAWARCRAKIIQLAGINPPKLRIPPEIMDENGYLKEP